MTCYAVIDTNVLVSAAIKWESVPGRIIALSFQGIIRPLLSEAILQEYHEVLLRPKFHLTAELVDDILDGVRASARWIEAPPLSIDLPDPKDRIFYEVLMAGRDSSEAFLITGNIKHFPRERYILTPRDMLDQLFPPQ